MPDFEDKIDAMIWVCDQFGDKMSPEQVTNLADQIRQWSIADREILLHYISGPLYTELSMMAGEFGGFFRY